MRAEQAEANILRACDDADLPGAITQDVFQDEHVDDDGNRFPYTQTYYTCGSCTGIDADEVRLEFKQLITQLTRRSAFLTMYGLFEHCMVGCLSVMDHLFGEITGKPFKYIADCHRRLTGTFGGDGIRDLDHLSAIRNIMAHNDGVADAYRDRLKPNSKTSPSQKQYFSAIRRAMDENAGIAVNSLNCVLMDSRFLAYAAGEFERYVGELEAAVYHYREQNPGRP
ncbi:hypothetical protein PMI17_00410 [Pantoea sp. GM01]|nr:hypothetical protein PMI17_00410 [Pantoea sp. GM01]